MTFFRASAATLLEIAADPKHLGAEIDSSAFFTPGTEFADPSTHSLRDSMRRLLQSPTLDSPAPSILPAGESVLSRVFRGKFMD